MWIRLNREWLAAVYCIVAGLRNENWARTIDFVNARTELVPDQIPPLKSPFFIPIFVFVM